jgi:hypothetical protein
VKQEKRRPAHSRKVSLRCSKAIATNMAGRGKLRTKQSRLQCWPRNAGANHPRRVGHDRGDLASASGAWELRMSPRFRKTCCDATSDQFDEEGRTSTTMLSSSSRARRSCRKSSCCRVRLNAFTSAASYRNRSAASYRNSVPSVSWLLRRARAVFS